jgi:hypothetical protein
MSVAVAVLAVGPKFMNLQVKDDAGAVTWYYQGVPVDGAPHVVCRMENGREAAELVRADNTPVLRQGGEGLPLRIVVRLADGRSTYQYRQRGTALVPATRQAGG